MKDAIKLGVFGGVAAFVGKIVYTIVAAVLTVLGSLLALALCYGLLKVLDKWELIFG
jgi:hypothetical protein